MPDQWPRHRYHLQSLGRKSRLVELRFFGGLTAEETAEVLEISLRTAQREWDLPRTWLFRELRETGLRPSGS
ncbi:MAG: hypothetical protein JO033_01855 [Acidobacteriaceae bacterium]|nr:hypothetical protein [Acidobacteriaceae bacterium]MBV9500201.1 hypothetical protein [Acidobacteriaceae bacterium]